MLPWRTLLTLAIVATMALTVSAAPYSHQEEVRPVAQSADDFNDQVLEFLALAGGCGETAHSGWNSWVGKKPGTPLTVLIAAAASCGYISGMWLSKPYTDYVCWESRQWWGYASKLLVSVATNGNYSRC